MDSNNAAIIIAILSAMTTIIGGSYATWQQLKKDDKQASIETGKLQEQIEETLWIRIQGEFDKMTIRIDEQAATIKEQEATIKEQSSTIAEQGAVIMQLREKIQKQDDRIKTLENENGRLKAENERLKGGGGRRV